MAKDTGFYNYIIHDVFAECDGITSRPMFGGWAVYQHGVVFALIADDSLYFKIGAQDAQSAALYRNIETERFTYTQKGKLMSLAYTRIPESLFEDGDTLSRLMKHALKISLQTKK